MSKRLNERVWCALKNAVSAALAGGAGGDFTDEGIEDIEAANEWLNYIAEKRGYGDDE